jgi:hypothetical protein
MITVRLASLKLCEKESDNQIFGALYRHPFTNVRPFTSYLGEFLETFTARNTKLTMLGDINIDLNKSNTPSLEYINTIRSVGFSTLINQPTRIFYYEHSNAVSYSTLDHIITNNSSSFKKVGILIAEISDHLPIFGFMSLSKPSRMKSLQNTYRRFFHESKKDKFLKCLDEKLKTVDLNINPDPLANLIIKSTQEAIDETFPLKKVSKKRALNIINPWMTKEILREQCERDKFRKNLIKSGHLENSPEHIEYKRIRNKVNKMVPNISKTQLSARKLSRSQW